MGVIKPENILDFKPQGYKFNDDTIRILQNLGVRSISGIFKSEDHQSFSACWYVKNLGKVTFPYPITNEFWAIPISEVKIDSRDIPLDDEYIDNPQTFLNYLKQKYEEQAKTKEPLIITLHSSITGTDETKLSAFSQFLDFVKTNQGKIKPLSALTHHTDYITNLDVVPSTTTALVGEEVTITVNYTSNVYCPYYRFLIYGRYPGKSWERLEGMKEYCEFVYRGSHTFTRKFRVPNLPIGQVTSTYTIRVVGRATFGGCPPIGDLTYWPNPENYDVKQDVEIEVIKPLCIPYIINGPDENKIDIVFVPDKDYGGDLTKFKQDVRGEC